MPSSCHDVTCLRRSVLWRRLSLVQLFDNRQFLLGDSRYVSLDLLVCSYKRTRGDMDKKADWSKNDKPIETKRDEDLGPPPQGVRDGNRRGIQLQQVIQDVCLEINRRHITIRI
ncbi:hypothetical protein R1sor_008186 [Riccia sorocarpa]|uniref:DDE Tnp4 domain-containing protein n=1 Tax=Riccia sorocarpa TaxID=122646 RepID=A0ABD3HWQ1_9MARC